jgi:DNA-binding CsgD family transcriptional regulator
MQHLHILYLFITAIIGLASLGIATADYFKTRENILLRYVYFHAALTLLVVSDLLLNYVALNLPGIYPFFPEFLDYLNVFVAQYALMITFPLFIHAFFRISSAEIRNRVFWGITVVLCVLDHVIEFLVQPASEALFPNGIDDLALMLVFFYGFITGISEYKHCDPEKAPVAKRFLVLLGVFMPAIIVDTLLHESLPAPLYPIVYCGGFSINFTHYLARYAFTRSQARPSSDSAHPVANSAPPLPEAGGFSADGDANWLTEELYHQYHISPREQDVLPLALQGSSNNQIAEALFLSLSTVKAHLRNIYAKFGVKNRYELVALLKHGDDTLLPRQDAAE